MPAPAVSVLVPVFNGEPFLSECLDSILAQDFSNFELLVSDDCSTDGSAALIRRHAERDARIRWWTNPRNFGIGGNWNACLEAAGASLIKFVLQDDKLLEKSALRRMAGMLNEDPSLSLVASASKRIDARSQVIRLRNPFGKSRVWDGRQVIFRCLEANANLIGEPSLVMFRKAQAARGFDARMVQLLDLEMWFHLLEQGRFAHIGEPLCAFREHPAQQTVANRRSGASAEEGLLLAERIYSRPWMKEIRSPRPIFALLYGLRKFDDRAKPLRARMKKQISAAAYAACWLRHKIMRPFQQLRRRLPGGEALR